MISKSNKGLLMGVSACILLVFGIANTLRILMITADMGMVDYLMATLNGLSIGIGFILLDQSHKIYLELRRE